MKDNQKYNTDKSKFIYFDVDGVIVLDFSKTNKWKEMISSLGIFGDNINKFNQLFDEYEPQICTGLNLKSFVAIVKQTLGIEFNSNYSMLEDFVKRLEINISIHHILNELSRNYKLGLLTNMYPGMLDLLNKPGILPLINWDVVIDSSIIGYRKPQAQIYEIA